MRKPSLNEVMRLAAFAQVIVAEASAQRTLPDSGTCSPVERQGTSKAEVAEPHVP